jgi:hypothetical protein
LRAARERFIHGGDDGAGEPPTIEDLERHNSLTEAARVT